MNLRPLLLVLLSVLLSRATAHDSCRDEAELWSSRTATGIVAGGGGDCIECPSHDFAITPTETWQTTSNINGIDGCTTYRVPVTMGQTYMFKTGCGNGATADHDTMLDLLNGNCLEITSNDDGCEKYRSRIVWTADYTGFAYVKVLGYGGAGGAFTMAYWTSGNTPICVACPAFEMEIEPTMAWQTTTSSHTEFGCKTYRVSVTAGQTYTFKTGCGQGATANYDTYLELADGGCVMVAYNDDGCEEQRSEITWTASSSDHVYLKVRGYGAYFGTYTLAYAREGSVTVEENTSLNWSIHPNPGNGMFTLANGSGSEIVQVELLDMAGRSILSRNDRIAPQVSTVVYAGHLSPGVYLVRVITSDNKRNDRRLVVQ